LVPAFLKKWWVESDFKAPNLLNSIPCFRNQARILFVCKKSYWYHLRRVVFNMIKIQHSRIYCRTIDIVNRFYRLLYSVTQVLEKMFLFISHFLISAHWKKTLLSIYRLTKYGAVFRYIHRLCYVEVCSSRCM
jgi:hypothetical protein